MHKGMNSPRLQAHGQKELRSAAELSLLLADSTVFEHLIFLMDHPI